MHAIPADRARDVLDREGEELVAASIDGWNGDSRLQQLEPDPGWSVWVILAGRGFGKTRTGAEWVHDVAEEAPGRRIALIAPTLDAGRAVMIDGASGLLACERRLGLLFEPGLRRLVWANGSEARLFSGGEPDMLRGGQFHAAWGDEAAHWPEGETTLMNLRLGLRLGPAPRLLLTTTPRPHGWLNALLAEPGVSVTRGRTRDNRYNLPPGFVAAAEARLAGTALGRQELDGEIVDDLPGALWTRKLLEKVRGPAPTDIARVVIGVDPPAGSEGICGIIVAATDTSGRAWLLADASVEGIDPNGWARAVVEAAHEWRADRVIAEGNNGGAMVTALLKSVDAVLPITLVHATRGKVARAEPVASLYVEGKVGHAGRFPALEDQYCGLLASGIYAGPGRSPDRADAAVWALWALMLDEQAGVPRVRGL